MKRILSIAAALLLLLTAAALAEGTPLAVTDEARESINIFLTNFSEQGLTAFVPEQESDAALCEFAARHLYINRPGAVEYGFWETREDFFSARLSDQYIPDIVLKYTGRRPRSLAPEHLYYEGGYYYFSEGAPIDVGFVSMSAVEALGGGYYGVHFGCYGQGWGFTNADCALRPEQAAARYPDCPVYAGYAVIDMGGGGPGKDRSGWRIISFRIDRDM